jgi:hypothetical protein
MLTLEKIMTELKVNSVNEVVGGKDGKKNNTKTRTRTKSKTKKHKSHGGGNYY